MPTQAQRRAEPSARPAPPGVVSLGERFKLSVPARSVVLDANRLEFASLPLDDLATAFGWNDESAELSGNIQMTDPTGKLHLRHGDLIACEWSPGEGQPFAHLWTLRANEPEAGMAEQSVTTALVSGLGEADSGTDDYSFRKDKGHPHGWTCDQIAHAVGKRAHLPIGKLARGTHRITKLVVKNAKPLDVIMRAYRAERVAKKRLFFVYWDGRLNVVPLTHSSTLLEFAGMILDANLQEKLRTDFATALTVRASTKASSRTRKGKATKVKRTSKKIVVKVQAPASVMKTYGYVHRSVTAPDAHSPGAAKSYGRNLLAKASKPERTFSVTLPIRPTLRRGDAFKVLWAAQGLTQVCYVASLSHQVQAGSATTEVTATFTDPFVDAKKQADKERRDAAAKSKGRTGGTAAPATSGGSGTQAKRRSD